MSLSAAQRSVNFTLRYYKPSAFGDSPAGSAMQDIRVNKYNFKVDKQTVESTVIGTRQVEANYKIGESVSFSFGGELCHAEWEFILEGLLGSTFTSFTTTQTDISFAESDSSINSSADFSSSVVAGQWIKVAGTADHNGYWYVVSKTSTSKMILGKGFTSAGVAMTVQDEAAGASMTVSGKHLRQGTSFGVYTFEVHEKDKNTWKVYESCFFDNIKIDLKSDGVVMFEVSGFGKVGDFNNSDTVASGGITVASTNPAFNATDNLIRIFEGSSLITDEMVSASMEIKVGAGLRKSLGNSTPTGGTQYTVRVSGDVEFYSIANTRAGVFQNHTDTPLYFALKDASTRLMILSVDRSYYQTLDDGADSNDKDVLEKYTYSAAKDATYSQTITVDVLS